MNKNFKRAVFFLIISFLVSGHAFCDTITANLHYAAEIGSVEIIKDFLERGADINSKDEYGRAPIHYAVIYGHVNAVKFLLEQPGILIDIKDNSDQEPLFYAKNNDHKNIESLLSFWLNSKNSRK